MKSKDVILQELKAKFENALKSEDSDAITQALTDFAAGIQEDVLNDYKTYQRTNDSAILAQRGVRQLTAEETKFYQRLGNAARTGTKDIKQAFEGEENAFPQTVIDAVLSDIKTQFPLLDAINVQNTSTLTKFIVNKKGIQLAVWGLLNSAITEELSGAIDVIDVGTNKLTAFMIISKDMLDAGPVWMDAYVRAVLVEANGAGLCKGIVAGTGKNEPIGMLKNVADDAPVVDGVYPDKTAVMITDLSPKTIGGIAKTIATGPNGRSRSVPQLLVVVNSVEYFDKIMPATTYLTPNGTYVNNVLPYPSQIVQDENVPTGKAIFGLAPRYFMGVGKGGSGGRIEYSDEYKFLEDERVYITKLLGNGRPLDNNAFVVADISGLTPANLKVNVGTVDGVVTTKEQA